MTTASTSYSSIISPPMLNKISSLILTVMIMIGMIMTCMIMTCMIMTCIIILSTSTSFAAELERIVAVIDGDPVTSKDLAAYVPSQQKMPGQAPLSQKEKLDAYILDDLIAREAKASGISVEDDDVKSYLAEIKKQNNTDDKGLEKLLAASGMNIKDYIVQVKRDILRNRLIGMKVRAQIQVSETEISTFLGEKSRPNSSGEQKEIGTQGKESKEQEAKEKEDLEARDSRRLLQVFVAPETGGEAGRERAKEKAAALHDALDSSGSNWKQVAKEHYSDLGDVDITELKPELQAVIEDIDEGEKSEIAETDTGFYIFTLLEKSEDDKSENDKSEDSPAEPQEETAKAETSESEDSESKESKAAELDPRRAEAKKILLERKFARAVAKYLTEELPKKYYVDKKELR